MFICGCCYCIRFCICLIVDGWFVFMLFDLLLVEFDSVGVCCCSRFVCGLVDCLVCLLLRVLFVYLFGFDWIWICLA